MSALSGVWAVGFDTRGHSAGNQEQARLVKRGSRLEPGASGPRSIRDCDLVVILGKTTD